MAVAADRELGMVTPLCLTWTAGVTLLQGAGQLLEIMQLSTEGWLLSARSWSETFLFILLEDTIRWESLLIITLWVWSQ